MFRFIPDLEQAVIDKLAAEHPGLSIGTREPVPRPTQYVRLFRITGPDPQVPVDELALITVETWHKTLESRAVSLAQSIRATILRWGWERGQTLTNDGVSVTIRAAAGSAPVNLPTTDGWARYTANYLLTISH